MFLHNDYFLYLVLKMPSNRTVSSVILVTISSCTTASHCDCAVHVTRPCTSYRPNNQTLGDREILHTCDAQLYNPSSNALSSIVVADHNLPVALAYNILTTMVQSSRPLLLLYMSTSLTFALPPLLTSIPPLIASIPVLVTSIPPSVTKISTRIPAIPPIPVDLPSSSATASYINASIITHSSVSYTQHTQASFRLPFQPLHV